MYTPPFNRADDEASLRAFVAEVRAGWLTTSRAGAAPEATFLPIMWRGDTVIAHFAKANPHWRHIEDGDQALVIVTGPDAYISPTWYATKAEHGKVVPTWNYSAVHLIGTARIVVEDEEWLWAAVSDLSDQHEKSRDEPWHITDAPEPYVKGQLRGIVGIELNLTSVEGKAKLSQNRSRADREGVISGLREDARPGDIAIANAMTALIGD